MDLDRLTTPWWSLRIVLGASRYFDVAAFTLARLTEAGIVEAPERVPAHIDGARTITA